LGSPQLIVRNAGDIVELAILKWASGCSLLFAEADALKKVDQAFKQDHGDMAIWDWQRGTRVTTRERCEVCRQALHLSRKR
jgi:hypothetical protein